MHHFIYPSKDTFITNRTDLDTKNFGIDEILQIGTQNIPTRVLNATKAYTYSASLFNNQAFESFTGTFTGSLAGSSSFASGSISGSSLIFSSSYFSGSINGVSQVLSASVVSGSLVNGFITGSLRAYYSTGLYTGYLTASAICLTGTGSGVDTRTQQNWTTTNVATIDRSLLAFNLATVSASIANGTIGDPHFYLRLRVCNEYQLPITYTIYALPISQSWNMGDGYLSDGGSDEGVSWEYRNNNAGTAWYNTSISGTRPAIDFISNLAVASASFGYGGGTWYTSSICSQSFSYAASDINMDVTPMVLRWLSGSTPNEGLMLVSSDELIPTGSGFTLKFFSTDTNTIYSPYLDLAWNDTVFRTGSISTSSVTFVTASSGISSSVQSGSTLTIPGGISGSFSGSAILTIVPHYVTASAANINGTYFKVTGSLTGSVNGRATINGSLTGSGLFTASYFSGSINGSSSIEVLNTGVSGSNISGILSGSLVTTGSISIYTGQVTSSMVDLSGSFTGYYLDTNYNSFCGFTVSTGLSGNVLGIPIFGSICGLISTSQSLFTGPCGNNFYAYSVTASFQDGPFSGSTFQSYYMDNMLENASITGSWTELSLLGASVNIILPSTMAPYTYAVVVGTYVFGTALGTYTISGSNNGPGSNSASFDGQFINGNLLGGHLRLQLSGSVYTSSFTTTGSVTMTSSIISPLDISNPFSINVQNLAPQYRAGDIVRVNVFGRKKFPLKYYGRATQQEQYMIPEFLPTSSYYALKDEQTEEIVLNFDSYTQISCDYPGGNYFMIDTTGLPQERYYRVLVKVQDSDEIYTIDTGKTFKIVRGGVST